MKERTEWREQNNSLRGGGRKRKLVLSRSLESLQNRAGSSGKTLANRSFRKGKGGPNAFG